ncbi:hypothetical protein [Paenibacillus ehimensis]|uniref:Uncharacterized protein n=1 Tax=Paenibacillus ehimensis TaxID=79264 RepID=A0ABT8VKB0_9BACL|nr:hypothetical protein [Paenibacillus ehimensis]MDO3681419.1 hypothetical protein [Paenibacillus ehimensis]MEC0208270.1 hypothetical protein [Paenibacillus ehimensis]
MAKNKNLNVNLNKNLKTDTEFSEEVVANNVKQPAQNNPSEGANETARQ